MTDRPRLAKYGQYNYSDMPTMDRYVDPNKPEPEDNHGITAVRKDAFDSMINLLLNHQQEIVKVPACSTLEGAEQWVKSRPGYRAKLMHLNQDRIPDIAVVNRRGAVEIVNGYKMKKSDFGLRNKYWEANPLPEHRAGNSMSEWARENCWDVQPDPENPWRNKSVSISNIGADLKQKGWRIPVRPKKQQTVYSIFCKLIKEYVNRFFETDNFLQIVKNVHSAQTKHKDLNTSNIGGASAEFIRRIISPIAIYRYLYMKLVLRNYFFQLVDQRKINANYQEFTKYMSEHTNQFFEWFCDNFLDKSKGLLRFSDARISDAIVKYNMCTGNLDVDGSDPNDGLVFLVGTKNWFNEEPVGNIGGVPVTFGALFLNNDLATNFLTILTNRNSEAKDKRIAKQAMAKYKKIAQQSAKEFFSKTVKQHFFLDSNAYDLWKAGHEAGCFTAGSQEAYDEHIKEGGVVSPTKPVKEVPESLRMTEEAADGEDDEEY